VPVWRGGTHTSLYVLLVQGSKVALDDEQWSCKGRKCDAKQRRVLYGCHLATTTFFKSHLQAILPPGAADCAHNLYQIAMLC